MPHPEVPDSDRPPGGERATFTRSDFRLLRRAARSNWGVPDELKTEALFQAAKILAEAGGDERYKLAAMRFLDSADRTDVLAEVALKRLDLAERKLAAGSADATDGGGVRADPDAVERALKALNGEDAT